MKIFNSFVKVVFNDINEEDSLFLTLKFLNQKGFRLFLDKRYAIIKNYSLIVNRLKKDNLISLMFEGALLSNLKNKEKNEIFKNMLEFCLQYDLKFNRPLTVVIDHVMKRMCSHLNSSNSSILFKQSILALLLRHSLCKKEIISLKLSLYSKKYCQYTIDSFEKYLAFENYYYLFKYDKYYDFLLNNNYILEQKDILILKQQLNSGNGIISSYKGKSKLNLLLFLININVDFTIKECLLFIKMNKDILHKKSFLNLYKKKIEEDKETHQELIFKFDNWGVFQNIISNKKILYMFLNNKFINLDYLIGDKIVDFSSMIYSPILEYTSLDSFFIDLNIKNKRVKKEIYNNIWNDEYSSINLGLFNRIIAFKNLFSEIDDQKLIPLLKNEEILNENEYIKVPFDIEKCLDISFDRIIHLYTGTFLLYKKNKGVSLRDKRSIIDDTCSMLQGLFNYINKFKSGELIEEQGLYLIESLIYLKKYKLKNFLVLHDQLSMILTKMNQVNYSLKQDDLLVLDKKSVILRDVEYKCFIPTCNYDLIDVGVDLKICVGNGSYSNSVLKEQINIIILKDSSFKNNIACIEINKETGKVIQSKEKYNNNFVGLPVGVSIKNIFE